MSEDPVAFVRVSDLFKHLRDFGYEREKLLAKAGITEANLRIYQENGELPSAVFSKLYYSAAALLPEALRQRYWAGGFSGRAFHLTAYAMIPARSLRQALQRANDLHQMTGERQSRISISSEADSVRLTYTPAQFPVLDDIDRKGFDADHIMAVASTAGLVHWFSFLSWIIGQRIKLNRVVFSHTPELLLEHKNSERLLEFNSIEYLPGDSFLEFSSAYMDSKVVITPASLDRYLEYSPSEAMPTLTNPGTVVARVQALIGLDFSNGFPSFKQLAVRMDMSLSTLRRRLMAESSSYQIIKDDARKALSTELLENSDMAIGDIAQRAGFISQGSFSRFFHQWRGLTPQHYRERHRRPMP